ncbi:DMT family transporter [Pseudotabrizicola sp. L79]|uniref:DMT family transporter n=1 Tax=Pseudotabrizicola sp. L79 TaxID=3118402 RepID=UPI002F935FEF
MNTPRPLWLIAAPAIFLVLWSAGFAIAKLGLTHAQPITLLALRYSLVLALLAPVALVLRPPMPKTWRAVADVALVGFLIQVVYFGMAYLAFKAGMSAGGLAIIVCLQPILIALLAPRLLGEPVNRKAWAGLGLGLAGALIVILSRAGVRAEPILSVVLTVVALIGITAGTLYEKRFGVSHHPVTSNLIQYAVGAVFTVPLALMTEDNTLIWNGEFIAILAYLVIGNSILAMSLLLAMIRAGEVSRVSSLFYLVPALSALFAWPLLGEAMPALAWLGLALAGAGVAMVSAKPRPKDRAQARIT